MCHAHSPLSIQYVLLLCELWSDSVCEHRDSRAGGARLMVKKSDHQGWTARQHAASIGRQASEHRIESFTADNVRIHARTFRLCAPFSSSQLLALVVCTAPTADTVFIMMRPRR